MIFSSIQRLVSKTDATRSECRITKLSNNLQIEHLAQCAEVHCAGLARKYVEKYPLHPFAGFTHSTQVSVHGRQLANDSLKAQLQATWPLALAAGAAGFACRAQNVSGPAKFGPVDRSQAWHTTNPDAGGKENSLRFLHLVSDLKRAATIAPGSVWKARISLPPLTRNPRMFMGEGSGGSVNTNCTEQSVST